MRIDLPDAPAAPGLSVRATPLFPLPDDVPRWVEERLREDAPAGAVLRVTSVHDLTTADGWPATLAEAELAGEARVVVLFSFLSWAGAVVVRCADPATWAAHRAAVLDALGRARPVWGEGEPVCLYDLLGPL